MGQRGVGPDRAPADSYGLRGTDLESVARGCGIPKTATVRNLENLEEIFLNALAENGPWFIVAKVDGYEHSLDAPIDPEGTLIHFRSTFVQGR